MKSRTIFTNRSGWSLCGKWPALGRISIRAVGATSEKQVDVRIICATNRDLHQMVQDSRFRGDLYYRLAVIRIHLPALRERKEDIPLLASHFLSVFAQRYRKRLNGFDQPAMKALMENQWQGNVRELNSGQPREPFAEQGLNPDEDVAEHDSPCLHRRNDQANPAGMAPRNVDFTLEPDRHSRSDRALPDRAAYR